MTKSKTKFSSIACDQKSKTKFSSIACDQAHEQTNKVIKSKSGLADVLNKEDSKFLRKL